MEENTVYITNYVAHDYSAAEKFGKLLSVTRGYVSFQSIDRVVFQVAEGLKNSRPTDYLLLSGTNIICAIAAALWIQMHGKMNLLYWDNKHSTYVPITMDNEKTDKMLQEIR